MWTLAPPACGLQSASRDWRLTFYFEPTFYVRNGGHMAGRINGSWDLFITQRLVVQPQAEMNFYSKDDPARQTGSGLSDIDLGVRLRYELTRKFNPYIGWAYDGKYGGSARYARQSREATSNSSFVFGFFASGIDRAWKSKHLVASPQGFSAAHRILSDRTSQ
jgi:uncharacterized protein involved in copper resistance